MKNEQAQDLEALARMAARLAGRDPDEHVTLAIGDVVAFKGPLWRYPDFLVRAETAYEALGGTRRVRPNDLRNGVQDFVSHFDGKKPESKEAR